MRDISNPAKDAGRELKMNREHITHEMLQAYVTGTLSVQAESEVIQHIAGCDKCAERFADLMIAENPVSPHPDLKKNILGRTVYRRKPFWAAGRLLEVRQTKQRELLVYCARVVFAMAASVLMVFSVSSGKYGVQRTLPAEMVQIQQAEPEHSRERKEIISTSLQKASGRVGDALANFLTLLNRTEEEEGE